MSENNNKKSYTTREAAMILGGRAVRLKNGEYVLGYGEGTETKFKKIVRLLHKQIYDEKRKMSDAEYRLTVEEILALNKVIDKKLVAYSKLLKKINDPRVSDVEAFLKNTLPINDLANEINKNHLIASSPIKAFVSSQKLTIKDSDRFRGSLANLVLKAFSHFELPELNDDQQERLHALIRGFVSNYNRDKKLKKPSKKRKK